MRVEGIRTIAAEGLVGRGLTLTLSRLGVQREVFACVPEALADELTTREDYFVPALVIAAMVNREDLDLGGLKVDPLLLRNALAAARQHQAWVPRFRLPVVSNHVADTAVKSADPGTALFFSGGIDSLFSLLRHSPDAQADATRVSDHDIRLALHIFHSGAPASILRNQEAEESLGRGAASLGAGFVPVFSNIMTFDPEWFQNYARVTHSAGLASIARLLSARLTACLIASSHTYGQLQAWGSSPIVDPLYSGRDLAVQHDGSTFTRFEKTEFISASPAALAAMNVCDKLVASRGYVNCSRCQKCLRTMTALDLCGVTGDAAPAFDWSDYTPRSFGEIYFKNWSELSFAEELVAAAQERGRPEIAKVIRSAIRRSSLLSPLSKAEDSVRHLQITRRSKSLLVNLRAGTYRALGLRR